MAFSPQEYFFLARLHVVAQFKRPHDKIWRRQGSAPLVCFIRRHANASGQSNDNNIPNIVFCFLPTRSYIYVVDCEGAMLGYVSDVHVCFRPHVLYSCLWSWFVLVFGISPFFYPVKYDFIKSWREVWLLHQRLFFGPQPPSQLRRDATVEVHRLLSEGHLRNFYLTKKLVLEWKQCANR